MKVMKQGLLTVLASMGLIGPCTWIQTSDYPVYELLAVPQQMPVSKQVTSAQRAEVYPSLALLPADVDSFIVFTKLDELMNTQEDGELESRLEPLLKEFAPQSFAIGGNEKAVCGLGRMAQVLNLLTAQEDDLTDQWVAMAEPDAARAVVAQQRALCQRRGEQLVQLTKDWEQEPIYMVLSSKPGGESMVKQLSVMLLMVPVRVEGPLELLMQGNRRGFCLRCDEIDLSDAGLAPEYEEQILKNLENKRLYVMAEARGCHLVLTISSSPDKVRIPERVEKSLLASDTLAAYDDMLQRETYVVAHSGASLVNCCRDVNLMDYLESARFMQLVFGSLSESSSAAGPAVAALRRLLEGVHKFSSDKREANSLRIWKDGEWYIHGEEECAGISFKPGRLGQRPCAVAENTVLFAESTVLEGVSAQWLGSVLNDVMLVQQGLAETLKPEPAAQLNAMFQENEWLNSAFKSYAALGQCLSPVLTGDGALVVHETGQADAPVGLTVCADALPADEAHPELWQGVMQNFEQLPADLKSGCTIKPGSNGVLFSTSAPAAGILRTAADLPARGGAVLVLNMPALARVAEHVAMLEQTEDSIEQAEVMQGVAQWLERLEAACTIYGNRLHYLLRLKTTE